MKRLFFLLIITCLVSALLAGCGENAETPTNAPLTPPSTVINNEDTDNSLVFAQPEESASVIARSDETPEETPENKQPTKPPFSQTPSKVVPPQTTSSQTPASQNTPSKDTASTQADVPVADIIVEYPTFTNEGTLKSWLLGNHPTYFSDGRSQMLSTLQSGTNTVYYKPSIQTGNSLFELSQVEVHTPSGCFNYFYNGTGEKAELVVFTAHRDASAEGFGLIDDIYDSLKGLYDGVPAYQEEGKVGHHFEYKGIDFYCSYDTETHSSWISWKQFGFAHWACLDGHFDKIEEIIPMLCLQQVKVADNTVTQ